jgi:hypothetical protein
MSFAEMFVFGEGGESEQPGEPVRPPWLAPPDDELGVAVPETIVLASSERGAVGLSHAVAHSTGVLFDFLAQARGLTRAQANGIFHEQIMFDSAELPDGLLRIGMELPGGARVSNLEGLKAMHHEVQPGTPQLVPHAGGGGTGSSDRVVMHPGYWLWPLPESGPLRISCEWPVVDIPLTTVEIDAAVFRAAAANVTKLWSSE